MSEKVFLASIIRRVVADASSIPSVVQLLRVWTGARGGMAKAGGVHGTLAFFDTSSRLL